MTPLAAVLFVGLFVAVAIAAFVASWWLSKSTTDVEPDPLIRAGAPDSVDPYAAARRAGGSSAWMRPDGGGF